MSDGIEPLSISAQEVRPSRGKNYACGGGQWTCPGCGRTVENASSMPGRPFWHDPGPKPGGRTAGPHDCPAGRGPSADDPRAAKYHDEHGRVLSLEEQERRGLL